MEARPPKHTCRFQTPGQRNFLEHSPPLSTADVQGWVMLCVTVLGTVRGSAASLPPLTLDARIPLVMITTDVPKHGPVSLGSGSLQERVLVQKNS